MNEPKKLSPPRRTVRPTGGPAGFVPRRLMRTAKLGLLAGAGVAGVLAVLPAPRGSERFEVALADWRTNGAWYAGDAPLDTTVPPVRPLGPGAAGPALLAEGGGPSAPRLATLPAGRDGPAAGHPRRPAAARPPGRSAGFRRSPAGPGADGRSGGPAAGLRRHPGLEPADGRRRDRRGRRPAGGSPGAAGGDPPPPRSLRRPARGADRIGGGPAMNPSRPSFRLSPAPPAARPAVTAPARRRSNRAPDRRRAVRGRGVPVAGRVPIAVGRAVGPGAAGRGRRHEPRPSGSVPCGRRSSGDAPGRSRSVGRGGTGRRDARPAGGRDAHAVRPARARCRWRRMRRSGTWGPRRTGRSMRSETRRLPPRGG